MDPISDGCRLCLDPFAERFTTIEDPALKNKMEKVFCFAVEPKQGHRSSVCQSCSYAISEFYQYSEKVRQNQEILNGNAVKLEPPLVPYETVKVEMFCDSEALAEETYEPPGEMIPEEEEEESAEPSSDQPSAEKTPGHPPEEPKSDDSDSEADEPSKNSEREKEYELFTKHFNMVCDLCGAQTENFKQLREHFWQEHQRRDGYVVCCNKKLAKRYCILDHIDYHANPDIFRCDVCGKVYKNKDTMNYHKAAVHEGKASCKVCHICGREYKSKEGFQQHMNEKHLGVKMERIQCHICLRWLKGRRNHRNHMTAVHGNNEAVECDVCQQQYPSVSALKSHKKQVHAEAKHECDYCGKRFKWALNLKEHRTTHTGEKLYNCEYCDMVTNSKAYVYRHVKQKHPAEWKQKQLNSPRAKESSELQL